jgi:transcriptional regulator with GAF, ATPase, and Fis domain
VKAREFFLASEDMDVLCLFWQQNTPADSTPRKEKNLHKERLYLEEINLKENSSGIISKNRKYRKVLRQVEQVADTYATVLIEGETGTGKELLANAIHQLSDRRTSPFVKINCAAIPEHLAGSELFGHEKGAFTGAFQRKIGRFELADGGTLLLDEIGELPIHLQSKLLRVLQEGEFERLGGNKTIKVDVRLIAATNRNLKKMIDEGKFREDLYFRLSVFPIYNLPLRERKDDIPLLAKFFIEKFNQKMGRKVKEISGEDLKVLMDYNFPGNIRELENIIERAIILSKGEALNLRPFLMQQQ